MAVPAGGHGSRLAERAAVPTDGGEVCPAARGRLLTVGRRACGRVWCQQPPAARCSAPAAPFMAPRRPLGCVQVSRKPRGGCCRAAAQTCSRRWSPAAAAGGGIAAGTVRGLAGAGPRGRGRSALARAHGRTASAARCLARSSFGGRSTPWRRPQGGPHQPAGPSAGTAPAESRTAGGGTTGPAGRHSVPRCVCGGHSSASEQGAGRRAAGVCPAGGQCTDGAWTARRAAASEPKHGPTHATPTRPGPARCKLRLD